MALRRFAKRVDGTIPVQALLYDDEVLYAAQDHVGIYDGPTKSTPHQSGVLSITSHRLFYTDTAQPASHSFAIDLEHVHRTDFFGGLFTSSPKISLFLRGRGNGPGDGGRDGEDESRLEQDGFIEDTERLSVGGGGAGGGGWECQVCGNKNPPGLSPAAQRVCTLCGVPRDALSPSPSSSSSSPAAQGLSASMPSSSGLAGPSRTPPPREGGHGTGKGREQIACPACTFLNHPSLRACELCETALPRPAAQDQRRGMKSAPGTRAHTPAPDLDEDEQEEAVVKLSFRKGGEKHVYAVLKTSLRGRGWEGEGDGGRRKKVGAVEGAVGPGVGISGILNTMETSNQGREEDMNDALRDLEALMVKAKDMVRLAGELNERLTAASASASSPSSSSDHSVAEAGVRGAEPEEATFIRSSLTQLGLGMEGVPVTLDMVQDERRWHAELARELARVLQGPRGLMTSSPTDKAQTRGKGKGKHRGRGIVALDEVWGAWNRARGVSLLPPATLLEVVKLLPTYTHPRLVERRFKRSGLRVVCVEGVYGERAWGDWVLGWLMMNGPGTEVEIARGAALADYGGYYEDAGGNGSRDGSGNGWEGEGTEEEVGVSTSLCREMMEECEREGVVCRDDVGECALVRTEEGAGVPGVGVEVAGVEVRWCVNVFVGYVWDGHTFSGEG